MHNEKEEKEKDERAGSIRIRAEASADWGGKGVGILGGGSGPSSGWSPLSMVTEPCLSIMGSFVAGEKVTDMTCSSQLSSGGEWGRPLKLTMSSYTQTECI